MLYIKYPEISQNIFLEGAVSPETDSEFEDKFEI